MGSLHCTPWLLWVWGNSDVRSWVMVAPSITLPRPPNIPAFVPAG